MRKACEDVLTMWKFAENPNIAGRTILHRLILKKLAGTVKSVSRLSAEAVPQSSAPERVRSPPDRPKATVAKWEGATPANL